MIFALMGSTIETEVWDSKAGVNVNETLSSDMSEAGVALNASMFNEPVCTIIVYNNITVENATCNSDNFTVNGCIVSFAGSADDHTQGCNATAGNMTYSYVYQENTTASQIVFETSGSISGVTNWYGIIITISVMVVLILFTVLIISAIRGTGFLGYGSGGAPRQTA